MALSLILDVAQTRLKRARIALTAAGYEFDGDVWANTYIDPETQTVILLPTSLRDDFHSSNSGALVKFAKTDYALTTSANWADQPATNAANDGPYLTNVGGTNEVVQTSAAWDLNRGVCLSIFGFNAGNGNKRLIEFGWSDGHDGAAGRSFRVYVDGTVEYWLDGLRQTTCKIKLPNNRNYLDLTVLPARRRELWLITARGQSKVIVCEDIAEDESSPVIVPAEDFWWYVPEGKAKVQLHKLGFATSGYVTTLDAQLGLAPPTSAPVETWTNDAPAAGVTNARVLADPAYAGTTAVSAVAIVQPDGSTAFTPDGSARDCRLKVSLTGDGSYTPFLYAAHFAYEGVYDDTDDSEEQDITQYVAASDQVTFDVPDDPSGVRLRFALSSPETLNAETIAGLLTQENRALDVRFGGNSIGIYTTLPPEFVHVEGDDENSRALIEARDPWARLEEYVFAERTPFDGMDLSKASGTCAVRFVVEKALGTGYPMALQEVDFKIDEIPADGGKFNFLAEVGDTAASVLDRLHYLARSFAIGFRPAVGGENEFFFLDPDDPVTMPIDPVLTLYGSIEDAISGGVAPEDASRFLYGKFRSKSLAVEANEVRVTGVNPRTRRPLQAFWVDEASQDPAASPSSRPDNWVGNPRAMGVIEPRATSDTAVARIVKYLAPIVSKRRDAAEWECLWPFIDNVPIWRWDVIALDGRGDYRISTINCTPDIERPESSEGAGDDFSWRPCRMSGVLVGTGTPYGQGGRDLDGMVTAARRAARNKTIRRPGWEDLARNGAGVVTSVTI